jgi:hypothetical protein
MSFFRITDLIFLSNDSAEEVLIKNKKISTFVLVNDQNDINFNREIGVVGCNPIQADTEDKKIYDKNLDKVATDISWGYVVCIVYRNSKQLNFSKKFITELLRKCVGFTSVEARTIVEERCQ